MKNEEKWFSMELVENDDSKIGVINIYDPIGKSGFFTGTRKSGKEFVNELEDLGNIDTLELHINSPGGSIIEGLAIISQIERKKESGVPVIAHIDGIAASMAGVIAMACDTIYMRDYSLLMIHRASGGVRGTADDMLDYAEQLEKFEESAIKFYEKNSDLEREEIIEKMTDTTWYTADEAMEDFNNIEIIKSEEDDDEKEAVAQAKTKLDMVMEVFDVPEKYKNILNKKNDSDKGVNKVVDNEMEEKLSKLEQENIEKEKELKKLKEEIEQKRLEEEEAKYDEIVSGYSDLPVDDSELKTVIKATNKLEDEQVYENLTNLLDSVKNIIAESALLEEKGSNVQKQVKKDPEEALEEMIEELMEKEDMSRIDALSKVYNENTDLVKAMEEGGE